jgi:hypothetical protein
MHTVRLFFLLLAMGLISQVGHSNNYSFSEFFLQKTQKVQDIGSLYKLNDSEIEKLINEANKVITDRDNNFICFKAALENNASTCSNIKNEYYLLGKAPNSCKMNSVNCKAMWIKLHIINYDAVIDFTKKGGCNSCSEKVVSPFDNFCNIFNNSNEEGPINGVFQEDNVSTNYRAIRKGANICICLSNNDSIRKTFTFDPENSFNYAKKRLDYFGEELTCENYKSRVQDDFILACANVCGNSVKGLYAKDNYMCRLEERKDRLKIIEVSCLEKKIN